MLTTILISTVVVLVSVAALRTTTLARRSPSEPASGRSTPPAATEQPVADEVPVWTVQDEESEVPSFTDVTAAEARTMIGEAQEGELCVLDVRSGMEVRGGRVPGSLWIPIDELEYRFDELPAKQPLIVVCAHGIRSAAACGFLAQCGHDQLFNVSDGMVAWRGELASA